MECVKCGDLGFNRVIIDVQTGDTLGGICERCEINKHILPPEGGASGENCNCVRCPQPGHIALPILECEIEHDGNHLLEYDLTKETPHLCEDCASIQIAGAEPVIERIGDSARS